MSVDGVSCFWCPRRACADAQPLTGSERTFLVGRSWGNKGHWSTTGPGAGREAGSAQSRSVPPRSGGRRWRGLPAVPSSWWPAVTAACSSGRSRGTSAGSPGHPCLPQHSGACWVLSSSGRSATSRACFLTFMLTRAIPGDGKDTWVGKTPGAARAPERPRGPLLPLRGSGLSVAAPSGLHPSEKQKPRCRRRRGKG